MSMACMGCFGFIGLPSKLYRRLDALTFCTNTKKNIFKKELSFIQDYCRMMMQDNSRMNFGKERAYG